MNVEINKILEGDFEKYMIKFYNDYNRFNLQDFSNFASTLLNYYVNNKIVKVEEKNQAAYYLTTLFNKGMGNRIIEEHLILISQAISSDNNVDFSVVNRIFS